MLIVERAIQVHNHCYETVDLDDMVRVSTMSPKLKRTVFLRMTSQITNEFQFSIAAFHHAHETYLVPETLKSAYGKPARPPLRIQYQF